MSPPRYTASIHAQISCRTLPSNPHSSLPLCERIALSTREYASNCFKSQAPLIVIISKLHTMDALALLSMSASR